MGSTEILVVFVKAPIPGRVKTRLAAEMNVDSACAIYTRIAEHVVEAVRHGPWSMQVWVDADDAADVVRSWLQVDPSVQHGVDLGERMHGAFLAAAGNRCVIIGTDTPDVDESVVRSAFDALDDHDVVIGPAFDGGYYLIGLRRPIDVLFRGIAWSTTSVLQQTLRSIEAIGVSVYLLSALRDIDTAGDLAAYRSSGTHAALFKDL